MTQRWENGDACAQPVQERGDACAQPGHEHGAACHERARIAAARIVTYDHPPRTPLERARMLQRLGITRIVWDWREEHTLTFQDELEILEAHGVTVTGLWCPMPLPESRDDESARGLGVVDPHVRVYLTELHGRGLTPDLWTCIDFGQEGVPERLNTWVQQAAVRRAADHLEPLARLADGIGMRVALTNHLGWFGEPENQIDVIDELALRGLTNVGLAYQLQHAHSHLPRFADLIEAMRPHLYSLALSGMDADALATGRKILPWGAGRLDRKLAHLVMASGWHGELAVQGHSADDAEARLLDSLEGIEWMIDRWQGRRHPRPVPRIATPAWPAAAGVEPPSMGLSRLGRHAHRGKVATGEIAPTLARVRTSPPEPAPFDWAAAAKALPPLAPASPPSPEGDPTIEATAVPAPTQAPAHTPAPEHAHTPAPAPTPAAMPAPDVAAREPQPPRLPSPRDPDQPSVLGGAFGALAATRSARSWLAAETPAMPERATATDKPTAAQAATDQATPMPQLWTASAAHTPGPLSPATEDIPLSLLRDIAQAGDVYAPPGASDAHTPGSHVSDETPAPLPLRISKREVSLDAPDPYTGALHALLTHLERVGFRGAPRSFGWDAQGRHLVEWVAGTRADHPDAPASALDPGRIGRFLREMHDALATFVPPADAMWFDGLPGPGGNIVIHQDIAPSNLVVRDDGQLVAIDWDAAAPGSRLWDLAHAVHAFAPLHGKGFDIVTSAIRMRDLVDGYGLTVAERERLVPLLGLRSERMYEYLDHMRSTGESPWIELWDMGVGSVWERDAAYIRDNSVHWKAALLS